MRIGAIPLGKDSGLAYYRLLIPLRKMTEKNPDIKPLIKFSSYMDNIGDNELEELSEMSDLCDIIIIQRRYGRRWKAMVKAWQAKGIKVVFEIDDMYENIPMANLDPRYRAMCSRETTKAVGEMLDTVDMITVSTPELGSWVKRFTNKKIVWLKNTIDFNMWKSLKKDSSDEVMIGYAASQQHNIDFNVLGGALHEICKVYRDKVSLGLMGFMAKDLWNLEEVYDIGVYYKAGVPFLEYPDTLAHLGFDIGLAPLKDCPFNRAKSELKYLEYSALKIPTVASAIAPYIRAIGSGDNGRGLLVDNKSRKWKTTIKKLLDNPELRKDMGEKAYEYVFKNYNIDTYVDKWLNVYDSLMKEK